MIRGPRSFAGQTLAIMVAVLLAAQILSMVFFGLFVLMPQARRVAGITAQSIAAASDAAELSDARARAAIITRLDASDYIDIWPGAMAPPASGPPPRVLEQVFMQALAEALEDRTELLWRTDDRRRLWIRVRIGPDPYWISARSPSAMQPLFAIMGSATAAFALALLAMVVLQRRLTRPLEALTTAVAAYGAQTSAAPVDERGPSELVALSRGFNAMTERLAATERERAIFLAGVSHDLRTPLAKLRLTVELLTKGDEALSRAAHGHVEEIDRVLGQFLVFARGFDAEPEVEFQLEGLLSEIVSMRAVEGFDFQISGDAVGSVRGRPEALRRALVNLTENATRYGLPPYVLGAECKEDGIEIFVRDNGSGAAVASLDRIHHPFVRGEGASQKNGGSGLGLAIVKRVAALHHGDLVLRNLQPHGFEARLSIRTAS